MVAQVESVPLRGFVPPNATVSIFINGLDQFPLQNIVADENGEFTVQIQLNPGENVILVQFFPPNIQQILEQGSRGAFNEDLDVVAPNTFSPLLLFPGTEVKCIAVQGDLIFIAGKPGFSSFDTIARLDVSTSGIIRLNQLDVPVAGPVRPTMLVSDASFIYTDDDKREVATKFMRYPLDLSARLDYTPGGTSGEITGIHADGTHVFLISVPGGSVSVDITKFDLGGFPTPVVGPINSNLGIGSSTGVGHSDMADDGTEIVFKHTELSISMGFGIFDPPVDGTPALGEGSFIETLHFQRLLKTTLANVGTLTIERVVTLSQNQPFMNSLVHAGGFFYTVIEDNQGKILKMSRPLGEWVVDEVIPLPFDTTSATVRHTPRMTLGGDGKLYIAGNGAIARLVPGSTTLEVMTLGNRAIAASSTDFAMVDDTNDSRVLTAPITLIDARAATVPVPLPAVPTNVRIRLDITLDILAIAWDSVEGNAYIVEVDKDGGGFVEESRALISKAALFSGGLGLGGIVVTVRIKAFNAAGTSAPSATATITTPFSLPPIADQTGLTVTAVTGDSISLEWTDNEIFAGDRFHDVDIFRSSPLIGGPFTVVGTVSVPFPATELDQILEFTDNTVDGSTQYHYFVRARSIIFAPSPDSNIVSPITLVAPPEAPTNEASEILWEGTLVTWDAGVGPGGAPDDYTVEVSPNGSSWAFLDTVTAPTTEFLHTNPPREGSNAQFYRVIANNAGGSSAPTSATPFTAFFPRIKIPNSNGSRFVAVDSSFAYWVFGDSPDAFAEKVDLTDSSVRSTHTVRVKTNAFIQPFACTIIGTNLHVVVMDNLENAKVVKLDVATMTPGSDLFLDVKTQEAWFVTDGAGSHWIVTWDFTSGSKIFEYNPTTHTLGASNALGANVRFIGGVMYFGGDIYISYLDNPSSRVALSRVSTTTLAIVESVTTNGTTFDDSLGRGLVNDGTKIYQWGKDFNTNDERINRFSVGPLTFEAFGSVNTNWQGTRNNLAFASGKLFTAGAGSNKTVALDPTTLLEGTEKTVSGTGPYGDMVIVGNQLIIAGDSETLISEDHTTF